MLTLKRLYEVLDYDKRSGNFNWTGLKSKRYAGRIAGTAHNEGYWQIQIDGIIYLAHRLAWFYIYGEWPNEIDHKDHDRLNNSIINLRDVNRSGNNENQIKAQKGNVSGYLGVSFDKRDCRYSASICVNGERIHIGRFSNPLAAHKAYLVEKSKLHIHSTL